MATQDNVSVFRRIVNELFMNKNPEAFEELLSLISSITASGSGGAANP